MRAGRQQGDTDLTEVVALLFVVTPSGKLRTLVGGCDEGEEIGRIVEQRVSALGAQFKTPKGSTYDFPFDRRDGLAR